MEIKEKDIEGYEGIYRIYSDGKVWSYKYKRFRKFSHAHGYQLLVMCKGNRLKGVTIHRLVYSHFVGKIPKGMQINHKDGSKTNNNLENLELCNALENTQHAWATGLSTKRFGQAAGGHTKLTEETVRKIRSLGKKHNQVVLGKMFNCSATNIHHILRRKTWPHVKA